MKTFQIDHNLTIVCEHQNTRSGFRHVAVLMQHGNEIERAKACYSNRTWERFEFESVLHTLLDKGTEYTDEQKKALLNKWAGRDSEQTKGLLASIGMIAKMGEVFTDTQEEANDWKLRMIKAGLPELDVPSDWATLSENEKESRLNKIIEVTK